MNHIQKLLDIMIALRKDCPWDRQQNFDTIAPYTVEEAYEVADAIANRDWPGLKDELGDLLFQVVFHARMAEEADYFQFDDVVGAVCDKLERRHPHVFGTAEERAAGPVEGSWEKIKAGERATPGTGSALDGITRNQPALSRAAKLGQRASGAGFDWPDISGVLDKIDEERTELAAACAGGDHSARHHELGDLLFSVVNLARHLEIDPEQALSDANRRFDARFRHVETSLRERGASPVDCDPDTLEAAWVSAKHALDCKP
ncbi:MAG: nucleoside triphosphate pyrophosphohydrolase [Halioglobus sp.]|nr:nucleoside triphosphate pyrophosphohydrolase [Halioglobus sp.]